MVLECHCSLLVFFGPLPEKASLRHLAMYDCLNKVRPNGLMADIHGGFVLIAPHAKTQIRVPLRLPAIVQTTIQTAVFNTTQDTTTVHLRSQAPAVGMF